MLETKTYDFLDTTLHGISNFLNQDPSFGSGRLKLYNGEHCIKCFVTYLSNACLPTFNNIKSLMHLRNVYLDLLFFLKLLYILTIFSDQIFICI